MKILLRWHCGEQYVWRTATYDGHNFVADGELIYETQIVSILNDNRKNYVVCSSCGKMFPKNGNKFKAHQENASSVNLCLKCSRLRTRDSGKCDVKYVMRDDGTYVKKTKQIVDLYCHYSLWNSFRIDSDEALTTCKFRMCEYADAKEINDVFIKYPGLFDDIITVDKILDNGYEVISYADGDTTEYCLNSEYHIYAEVNRLGIVDRFIVKHPIGYNYVLYYSKKYDMFFDGCDDRYQDWTPYFTEIAVNAIQDYIRKLYK